LEVARKSMLRSISCMISWHESVYSFQEIKQLLFRLLYNGENKDKWIGNDGNNKLGGVRTNVWYKLTPWLNDSRCWCANWIS
jgi:hypothetical protein